LRFETPEDSNRANAIGKRYPVLQARPHRATALSAMKNDNADEIGALEDSQVLLYPVVDKLRTLTEIDAEILEIVKL
jgi:hypothetical protein